MIARSILFSLKSVARLLMHFMAWYFMFILMFYTAIVDLDKFVYALLAWVVGYYFVLFRMPVIKETSHTNPLVLRITTSALLCIILGSIYLFNTLMFTYTIWWIYGYAFFIEYFKLLHKTYQKIPFTALTTGALLAGTGIAHVLWLTDMQVPLYLGICVGAAVLSDIGGYIMGNLWGAHALVPTISPKKTWEGLVGSVMLTSAAFFGVAFYYPTNYHPLLIGLLGGLLAIAGLLGDLLVSYIKRTAGVKDTGNVLPGHGGILDRLDSIIGTTTLFMLILALLRIT